MTFVVLWLIFAVSWAVFLIIQAYRINDAKRRQRELAEQLRKKFGPPPRTFGNGAPVPRRISPRPPPGGSTASSGPSPHRALCASCGWSVPVNNNGLLRAHPTGKPHCTGSGQQPNQYIIHEIPYA